MTDDPKKILVVDDEAQITRVLLRGLESAGYQVRVANDGRAGLETFRTWLPDLVITDLSMPGYTGLELCERIRQLSEVPVLVLSVKEDEPTKVKAFDLGADDYVSKPFGMAELTARVRALLRRSAVPPQSDTAYQADPSHAKRVRHDSIFSGESWESPDASRNSHCNLGQQQHGAAGISARLHCQYP
jgi:DNA-binding response OmpR family regulator